MARVDQVTVKMSRKTYNWLLKHKQETGVPIRFTIDQAIEWYKKCEVELTGTNRK